MADIKDMTMDDLKFLATVEDKSLEWGGYTINIHPTLSLMDMLSFVNTVVDSCFSEDTGEYRQELGDFALRREIVSAYTDMKLPDDLNLTYSILYNTDISEYITEMVNSKQLEAMIDAINMKVEHRASANIEAISQQVNKAVAEFDKLVNNLGDLFSGIDKDTMTGIADAVANGAFDETKLINAVMDYSNSQDKAADGDA